MVNRACKKACLALLSLFGLCEDIGVEADTDITGPGLQTTFAMGKIQVSCKLQLCHRYVALRFV